MLYTIWNHCYNAGKHNPYCWKHESMINSVPSLVFIYNISITVGDSYAEVCDFYKVIFHFEPLYFSMYFFGCFSCIGVIFLMCEFHFLEGCFLFGLGNPSLLAEVCIMSLKMWWNLWLGFLVIIAWTLILHALFGNSLRNLLLRWRVFWSHLWREDASSILVTLEIGTNVLGLLHR